MGLVLYLKHKVTLSDDWISKADWEEVYKDNLPALWGLFEDDCPWEDMGGIEIIECAEWEE